MKPRAIIYIRQSVSREDSISPELQETACRQYAERKGYEVVDVEQDLGISGRTWKRPAVLRVMEAIERGHCDVILLWKWSRLSRSRRDWAVAIDRCDVAGGRIESSTEEIDTSTATGRLARGMLVEFAAFESERIGDTWKESHARRIAAGKPHNGGARFGYTKTADGGYEPDPVTAGVVRDLYARYIAGASFRALAFSLNERGYRSIRGNEFTAASVLQMLDRVFYTGQVAWHGGTVDGEHEGLIDMATWQAYRDARHLRRVADDARSKRQPTLLAGFLRCGCGAKMNGHDGPSRPYPRYECGAAYRPGTTCDADVRSVDLRDADGAIGEWVEELATSIDDATPHVADPDATAALTKIGDTHKALNKLTIEYARGIIPEPAYKAASAALTGEIEALERDAERALRRAGKRADAALLRQWDLLTVQQRRALLGELVERIDWKGPRGVPKEYIIRTK